MKKIIALVLSLILAFSACMIPVSADSISDIGDKIQTEAEDAVNDTKFIFEATIVRFKNAVHRVIEVLSNLFGMECPWCAAGDFEFPECDKPEDTVKNALKIFRELGLVVQDGDGPRLAPTPKQKLHLEDSETYRKSVIERLQ